MYAVVYIYVFCECLFLTRSTLTYTIYESALNPSNIKVKIDGTIDIPDLDRKSAERSVISRSTENDHHEDYPALKLVSIPTLVKETDKALDKDDLRQPISVEGAVNSQDHTGPNTSTENDYHEGFNHTAVKVISERPTSVKKTDKAFDKDNIRKPKPVEGAEDSRTESVFAGSPGSITKLSHKKPHKVKDDEGIRKFTEHIYRQTLKTFEAMKQKSDTFTQQQIDSLAKSYKEKFTDFVLRTRQTDIKTRDGPRNVLLHIIETSNLMLDRIVNFLKANMVANGPMALRGGATRLEKEVETVKKLEYEHACKKFGACRSSQGFRIFLQDVISILLKLPDGKLIQVNDAATEILKNADLSPISETPAVNRVLNRGITSLEKIDVQLLKSSLMILYGALSKSHLPLIVNKAVYFEKKAVKRTVTFHGFIDALEEALPPTETNKMAWAVAKDRLRRWAADQPLDIQDILKALFDNVMHGVSKSEKIRQFVAELAKPYEF